MARGLFGSDGRELEDRIEIIMKTLVYIIPTEFYSESDGVTKKAKLQTMGMAENGYLVTVIAYDKDFIIQTCYRNGRFIEVDRYKTNKQIRRNSLFIYAIRISASKQFDTCYIRYPYASILFIRMLRALKKTGAKVILEIPSFPIPHPKHKGLIGLLRRVMYFEEFLVVNKLKEYVDTIYSIGSPTKEIFGVRSINIPNGTTVDDMVSRSPILHQNEIHILFYANFYSYQGLDRLLNGLKSYLLDKSIDELDVFIEVVGDGPEMEAWKTLAAELDLGRHVVFHGFLTGTSIDEIFNLCGLACSTLAPHRGGIVYASPLKTKEFLARGIPFVYAYEEIGMDEDVSFALKIESSDSPINLRSLIDFFTTYSDHQEETIHAMREYAKRKFSWQKILQCV